MKRNSQRGVALVITLLFLAVITFMTVTFLVVTQREREQTQAQSNQTDASLAADAAVEQAKAAVIASMLARTNGQDFGLMVSTNYISSAGFDTRPGVPDITNVNYDYLIGGGSLPPKAVLQNLLNLQILPRPPVYVTTNKNFPPDFRYYIDLNRNGVHDTNGFGTNYAGGAFLFDNTTVPPTPLTTTFVGDPEWIGVLDKPYLPHSSSNQFVARYAFFAVPIGNDLDLNYIHNDAKLPKASSPFSIGYLRDQGFGSWEINLAAFLFYLNTNEWGNNPLNGKPFYSYSTDPNANSIGAAFNAAKSLLAYRYNNGFQNNYLNLNSADTLFGNNVANALAGDYIDSYTHGEPLWTTTHGLTNDPDGSLLTRSWAGSDNPSHFFSSQDLFNPDSLNLLMGPEFVQPLIQAGLDTNNSYDRYTFYRMFAQMGVGSAPETAGKINLNYDNVHYGATNFVSWDPLGFFTNAANVMLQSLATNNPGYYPPNLSITNIPLYPTNYYTAAVNRLLQLAANIYDASTNIVTNGVSPPDIFRPLFGVQRTTVLGVPITNVLVSGYELVKATTVAHSANNTTPDGNYTTSRPLALPDDLPQIVSQGGVTNLYGVPYVVGAKKGLPNFNEFSYQYVSQITRRVEINKVAAGKLRSQWLTNQMYQVGVSNIIGFEAWNSYANAYPGRINLIIADDLRMYLSVTNEHSNPPNITVYSTNLSYAQPPGNFIIGTNYIIPALSWTGFPNSSAPSANAASFQTLRSNVVFVPDLAYVRGIPALVSTNVASAYEPLPAQGQPVPHFLLSVTNRLRAIMIDPDKSLVLDYVQLAPTTNFTDLTAELTAGNNDSALHVWDTNFTATTGIPVGVNNQLQISLGNTSISDSQWANATGVSIQSVSDAISGFESWYNTPASGTGTNLVQVLPFTPTAKYSQSWTFQANDPLVHYTVGDLNDPSALQGATNPIVPPNTQTLMSSNSPLQNIGLVNTRYHPWSYYPNQTTDPGFNNLAIKDPMVTRSDDWDFPTNKYANVGWLGRVHRGTPWQTVYLKSPPIDTKTWIQWTGNTNVLWNTNGIGISYGNGYYYVFDSTISQPTNDWKLLDLFTTAPNDNAARGRLSVNQTNFAAWAAIFNGVVALTNSPTGLLPWIVDTNGNDPNMAYVINAINVRRATNYAGNTPYGVFTNLGDILSVPELTVASPYINATANTNSLSDGAYERLPQQVLGLLKVGQPRYVIYAYGQSLKPADHSILQSSAVPGSFGLCTNYQITGELETRTVVRFDNSPVAGSTNTQPHAVIESFNVLPPE
jgi:hypothetical protein